MHTSPRAPRSAFIAVLITAALALGGCVMNAGGGGEPSDDDAAAARTALPPPDMAAPKTPATDASGKPLVSQPEEGAPLSNEAIHAPSGAPRGDAPGEVDYTCTTDADCAVKDVGNCCGYYPACVNADSPTFPEQVKAECAKNDMQSVCGFREIEGCACVEGRCAAGPATSGEAVR